MPVIAVQHIRRMRGGAQPHLMLGDDFYPYVVKFRNNPQHLRVLANEYIASQLAAAVGFTTPEVKQVYVSASIIEKVAGLEMTNGPQSHRCSSGLQFGSRLAGGQIPGLVLDYLPRGQMSQVRNLSEFAGMLAFDKWSCNRDNRQAVFVKHSHKNHYVAHFIDYGHCFGSGEWRYVDQPAGGMYNMNEVYEQVTDWSSFEPWLSRIERFAIGHIRQIALGVPAEWYDASLEDLERMIEQLAHRRGMVRDLIEEARESDRNPFRNWKSGVQQIGNLTLPA